METGTSSTPTTTTGNKGDQSKSAVKEKPKIPTKPQGLTNRKTPHDAPHQPKSTETASNIRGDKKAALRKSLSEEETKEASDISPADKCVVCARTVYQMEKCNLDSSVLHRQCVKCSVCKRLLTVGNFVIAESKVYCKPHGQALTVSL